MLDTVGEVERIKTPSIMTFSIIASNYNCNKYAKLRVNDRVLSYSVTSRVAPKYSRYSKMLENGTAGSVVGPLVNPGQQIIQNEVILSC